MVEAGDTRWTPRVTPLLSLPACAPDSVVVEQAHGFCCFGPHQRAGVLQQQDQGCGHRVSKVRAVDTESARSGLWTQSQQDQGCGHRVSKVRAVDTARSRLWTQSQQGQGCGHRVSKVRAVDTARSRLWTHSKVKAVDTESARSGLWT